MGAPQIIVIILLAIGSFSSLSNNGKAKGHYSFNDWLISPAIWVGLLYWGGFFS